MDAELVTLAGTAATTIVEALVTDAWEKTKSVVSAWWRRHHLDGAETIETTLVKTRTRVLDARSTGDSALEEEQVVGLRSQIRGILTADPGVAAELRQLVDELRPDLPAGTQMWTGNVRMNAKASGHAQINQVGQGTQHISGR